MTDLIPKTPKNILRDACVVVSEIIDRNHAVRPDDIPSSRSDKWVVHLRSDLVWMIRVDILKVASGDRIFLESEILDAWLAFRKNPGSSKRERVEP